MAVIAFDCADITSLHVLQLGSLLGQLHCSILQLVMTAHAYHLKFDTTASKAQALPPSQY